MDHGIDLVREELIDEKKELELDYNLIKKLESEIELLMMWKREGVKGVAYVKASGETETIYKICDPNRPSFDDFYLLTP